MELNLYAQSMEEYKRTGSSIFCWEFQHVTRSVHKFLKSSLTQQCKSALVKEQVDMGVYPFNILKSP